MIESFFEKHSFLRQVHTIIFNKYIQKQKKNTLIHFKGSVLLPDHGGVTVKI